MRTKSLSYRTFDIRKVYANTKMRITWSQAKFSRNYDFHKNN